MSRPLNSPFLFSQPEPSVPARFLGLAAGLVTRCDVKAAAAGPAALDASRTVPADAPPAALAAAALALLGLDGNAATAPLGGLELVIVHCAGGGGEPDAPSSLASPLADAENVLRLVGSTAPPGSLLVALVLGAPSLTLPPRGGAPTRVPGVPRPLQSFETDAAGVPVPLVTPGGALVAVRLRGVTRTDPVAALDAGAARTAGALGAVQADTLLADLAFKLGRLAKYGA